ncbi:hypothetical protein NQ317_004484 [Molorchus minor]|uniref:Rab-GAP TBC domain-containing protein n=1 Tax=Molorchus minor TaxID=1323400 RepID=A0ABQ9IUY1_9CUCU|nr:hypothetical protein NQ317_004484 [Molorchus minor]
MVDEIIEEALLRFLFYFNFMNTVNSVLTFAKLNPILKEFGEYPEKYRRKIWEKILQLPNNIEQYNNIINHITVMAFEDLYFKYPLENIGTIKCLRKLLNNVVNWCPFIVHIDYLPMFAFPFVKVFENTPVACFEAICTILLNWCQHWFDYFPLPPMNILIIIENMLVEHDPELFYHFQYFNITTELYGWTLLETAFTEVLTASEWLILWDHILTNKEDPSFFLCATVSYNFVHKNILKSLKTLEEFEFFYHNQNPNDMKTFLNKTYYIMKNTSAKVYPGQYYRPFKYIENGKYPLFENYPKTMCNLYIAKDLFSTLIDFDKYGTLFFEKARRKWKRANLFRKRREEIRRQIVFM